MLVSRADYVPFWDGRFYTNCVLDAASGPFAIGALRCGEHASHAFMAFAALAQTLVPGGYAVVVGTNALVFLLACVGFHRLARLAFPADDQRVDRALLTATFALQPALLAAVVHPGIDLPLVPGFVWCTVFLLERRWVAVVMVGLAMAFTKETGVLLYAVLLGCYAVWFVLRAPGSARSRAMSLVRLIPLGTPGFAFGAYLLYRRTLSDETVLWRSSTIDQSLVSQLLVPRLDLWLISYLAIMLVLNFAWIASGWVAFDLFVGTVRRAHRLPRRPLAGADGQVVGFLMLLTVVTAYALSRFITLSFPRYLLVFLALLPVPFYAALLRFQIVPLWRRAILAIYAVLLLGSTVRTIDPVSRRLWGTFPIGNHDLLRLTRVVGECCGAGQDHIVYSLQFTVLSDLQSKMLAAIAPNDSTVLVVPDSADWQKDWRIFGELDETTHRRTLAREGVVRPTVIWAREIMSGRARPATAWFIALPMGSVTRALRDLAGPYVVGEERRFWIGGYSLSAYPLTLRDTGQ